jgi:hypothetical protein
LWDIPLTVGFTIAGIGLLRNKMWAMWLAIICLLDFSLQQSNHFLHVFHDKRIWHDIVSPLTLYSPSMLTQFGHPS